MNRLKILHWHKKAKQMFCLVYDWFVLCHFGLAQSQLLYWKITTFGIWWSDDLVYQKRFNMIYVHISIVLEKTISFTLPSHFFPSEWSSYPILHSHLKLPRVFTHMWSHPCWPVAHSSYSVKKHMCINRTATFSASSEHFLRGTAFTLAMSILYAKKSDLTQSFGMI